MKKNKIYYIYAIAPFLFFGCSNSFLEELPQDKISSGGFYQTQAELQYAVNAVYSPLRDIYDETDNYLWDMTTDVSSSPDGTGLSAWIIYSTDGTVAALWSDCYKGINLANIAISHIPDVKLDDATKNDFLGEARFLRALYYHVLVSNFGDVPLITEPQDANDLEVPRTPSTQIFDQIISDLTFAEGNLPSVKTLRGTGNLGRATSGAASGLLSRVYLYLKNWQKSAEYANKVIQSTDYSLMTDYSQIFTLSTENNKESLFEVQFVQNSTPEPVYSQFSSDFSPRGNPITSDGWGKMIIRQGLPDLYEQTDVVRRKATLYMAGDDFFGIPYNPGWSETGLNIAKYILTAKDAPTYQSGIGSALNQQIMRYAEIFLNYAEAEMQLGNKPEALSAINQVRARAGINVLTSDELTLDAIYHERLVEFAMEGQRLNDLRRTGTATSVLAPLGFDPSKHYVFPIPQDEIDRNPLLEQNPNY